MDDLKIVQLYWNRDEAAIAESSLKYGAYCSSIAFHILHSASDAEECVNDTWLQAWRSMPPHRPSVLSVFLGKITRNLALDVYRRLHREKRGGDGFEAVLDELAECVSDREDTEQVVEREELMKSINAFLQELPAEKRYMFVRRYWYADGISAIAERLGMRENAVSVSLNRIRAKLKQHLMEGGFEI